MPIDTKNVAENRICSGITSPSARAATRLSLTISPARNAPSEMDTSSRLVRYAVPKQIARMASRNTSWDWNRET